MSETIGLKMFINQGDVYWLQANTDTETVPHPYLVIQEDSLNHDPTVKTVILCALTTNLRKISIAGNVLLEIGEANLPKQSIVEVSKTVTIDKEALGDYIGTVSEQRVKQILAGIKFVENSFLSR
jgi:mRNA interferase MazF